MLEKNKLENITGEKTFIKGIGFLGNGVDGNMSTVDVKDGKIVRIRPFYYDWKYHPEEFNPWKIEARGQVVAAPLKKLIPPLRVCYKKRINSPNRILYPLKRADFDPPTCKRPYHASAGLLFDRVLK
jgi:hypothetical protein